MTKTGNSVSGEARKEALATARHEGRIVSDYLKSLNGAAANAKGQPKMDQETVDRKIGEMKERISTLVGIPKLKAMQKLRELKRIRVQGGPAEHEAAFVKVAKHYGEAKGIEYGTWRQMNVPAKVLEAAGITRNRVDL